MSNIEFGNGMMTKDNDVNVLRGIGLPIRVWNKDKHGWRIVTEIINGQDVIAEMKLLKDPDAIMYQNKMYTPGKKSFHFWLWLPTDYKTFSELRQQCDDVIIAALYGYQREFTAQTVLKFFPTVLVFLAMGMLRSNEFIKINLEIFCRLLNLWFMYRRNMPELDTLAQQYYEEFRTQPSKRSYSTVRNLYYFMLQIFVHMGSASFNDIRQIFIDEFFMRESFTIMKTCGWVYRNKVVRDNKMSVHDHKKNGTVDLNKKIVEMFNASRGKMQVMTWIYHLCLRLCVPQLSENITVDHINIPQKILAELTDIYNKIQHMDFVGFMASLNLSHRTPEQINTYMDRMYTEANALGYIDASQNVPKHHSTAQQPSSLIISASTKCTGKSSNTNTKKNDLNIIHNNVFDLLMDSDSSSGDDTERDTTDQTDIEPTITPAPVTSVSLQSDGLVTPINSPTITRKMDNNVYRYGIDFSELGKSMKSWADYSDDE